MSTNTDNPTAAPGDNAGKPDRNEQLQLVTFKIAKEEFGVDILAVQEINRMLQVTAVPQCPACVEGVINLRGRIIPVIDLRKRFGMPTVERDRSSRIIVVDVSGRTVGFVVDQVDRVLRLPRSIVDNAPSMVGAVDSDYIAGIGKLDDGLIILLNLDRLLTEQMAQTLDATVAKAQAPPGKAAA